MIKIPAYYKSPHKIAGAAPTDAVLLALSGGADSVSLLYNLVADGRIAGFTVFAAHVNHNIRLDGYNNEAARDEEFCRRLCKDLGVKLFVRSIDVPALAKECGESIESAARRARYDFFAEVMAENGISLLVTAHNATDNFETQIFNLCRGTGIAGMAGIPERRVFDENKIIVRPILSATKAEILEFCSENSILYVTDSTNFENDATRNKIRNVVLPELEKIFPSAQSAASRLAASATHASDYIKAQAYEFLDKEAAFGEEEVSFAISSFNALHIAIRERIVAMVAESFGASLESVHIQSAMTLIERSVAHSSIDLPCRLMLKIQDGSARLSISKSSEDTPGYELAFDGKFIEVPNTDFCVVAGKENLSEIDTQIYNLYTSAALKGDRIKDGLLLGRASVRSRREGDRIVDGGNTKKLKKLMCDKKVPLAVRSTLPLLCLDGEIIYAPMCAICDDAKRAGEGEIQIFIFKK